MTTSQPHSGFSQKGRETDESNNSEAVGWCVARFPASADPKWYISSKTNIESDKLGGFIVMPWAGEQISVRPLKFSEVSAEDFRKETPAWEYYDVHMPSSSTQYSDYLTQFNSYTSAFAKGTIKKTILSRIKMVEKPLEFEPMALFETLCQSYPSAFVYLISHPKCGLWMGASPELLLKRIGNHWQTVSLAGTKPSNENKQVWTPKELEEQEMVSMHIRASLKKAGAENISEDGPNTVEAGAVAHLQTVFDFDLGADAVNAARLISGLHPTPAVAGLPVKEATALIARTEAHHRGLYTGYLGQIDGQESEGLYVNLRCMQIGKSQIALYLGGGITSSSNPKAEWEETEHKALTLYQHLNEPV